MGKSSDTPQAPDPYKLAELQGTQNLKALQLALNNSRTNTVNPFGSSTWAHTQNFDQAGWDKAMAPYSSASTALAAPVGSDGHWQSYGRDAGTTWEPGGGSGTAGAVGAYGAAGSGVDASGMPKREDYTTDSWTNNQVLSPESQGLYDQTTKQLDEVLGSGAYDNKLADAVYQRMRLYQDPADERARSAFAANMADRGFDVGSEGYKSTFGDLNDSQARSRTDSALAAQNAGAQQGLSLAQLLSSIRNQQVQGVSGMPTTTTTPSISPVDISGMIQSQYQDQLQASNAENASSDGLLGSLLQMGGMALGGPAGSIGGKLAGKFFGV